MRTALSITVALVAIFLAWGAFRGGEPQPPEAETVDPASGNAATPMTAGAAAVRDPIGRPAARRNPGPAQTAPRGRVLDVRGGPLAGVPILVGGEIASHSDHRGWFSLPAEFASGALRLAEPWVAVYTETTRGEQPGTWIVAALALDLEGTVTDPNGQPLADVEVTPRVEPLVDYPHALETARRVKLTATVTDGNGRFAVTDLPLDAARIEFRRPGYATEVRAVTTGSSMLHIVLSRVVGAGRRIRGLVLDPWRQPLAGARVGIGGHETRTDAAGGYEIVIPSDQEVSGRAVLWAARPGLRTATVAGFGKTLAESTGDLYRELHMAGPALEIAGRVVYHGGEPATGVALFPWREEIVREGDTAVDLAVPEEVEPLNLSGAAARSHARTGADGSFRLGGFAARSYTLRVLDRKAGWGFSSEPIPAGSEGVTIRLPADLFEAEFSGRVVTPDGEPVPGLPIRISLSLLETAGGSRFLDHVGSPSITDAEGRFRFSNFSYHGASFWVGGQSVDGAHFVSKWVTATHPEPGGEFELEVERRCRFRVHLMDPDFASARIRLLDSSGRRVPILRMLANSTSMGIVPTLRDGKSIELGASERAAVLVAVAGERELQIPIRLRADEVVLVTR